MHVISRKKLKEAAEQHADLEGPLDAWFRISKKASWKSLADVRKTFSSADGVGKWTVFNIKGNDYRLVAALQYQAEVLVIRFFGSHGEYNRIDAEIV